MKPYDLDKADSTELKPGFVSGYLLIGLIAALYGGCSHDSAPPHRPPSAFADLEEGAEDVFDLAATGNWRRATLRTNLLRETSARLETSEGRKLPELEAALTELERAVNAHDVDRSTRSANAVMRETVHLAAPYLKRESVTILMLDVEAHEVIIDADMDPHGADAAVSRIEGLWTELRPEVEHRGGHDLARRCDAHLATMKRGGAPARRTEADSLLDTIDQLEDLFL